MDPIRHAVLFMSALMCGGCVASDGGADKKSSARTTPELIPMQLPAGAAEVDVYWPDTTVRAPMVIIAHGFLRHRQNMAGWGRHLATRGIVAVVPDLPARSDHARNSLFISDLQAHLTNQEPWKRRIDSRRVGLMGFSAGGLSTLLAAARSPNVAIWVGLDPVDRDGMGAKAAAKVRAHTVVLTAEPSSCNAQGNARNIVAALPRPEHFRVPGSVHVDAEWPTSRSAELVCGRSTEEKRREFRVRATNALCRGLAVPR